jgi:hypothetical protein
VLVSPGACSQLPDFAITKYEEFHIEQPHKSILRSHHRYVRQSETSLRSSIARFHFPVSSTSVGQCCPPKDFTQYSNLSHHSRIHTIPFATSVLFHSSQSIGSESTSTWTPISYSCSNRSPYITNLLQLSHSTTIQLSDESLSSPSIHLRLPTYSRIPHH